MLIGTLGTNFNEILSEIRTFSFIKMHLKMSSAKWRPFILGLNVLSKITRPVAAIKSLIKSLRFKPLRVPRGWNWRQCNSGNLGPICLGLNVLNTQIVLTVILLRYIFAWLFWIFWKYIETENVHAAVTVIVFSVYIRYHGNVFKTDMLKVIDVFINMKWPLYVYVFCTYLRILMTFFMRFSLENKTFTKLLCKPGDFMQGTTFYLIKCY